MALCTVTDGRGNHVTVAVEHLQELANRMLSYEFGFHGDDVFNIDKVIEAIQELEIEREKVHELFETETITASVLRHKLQFYPEQIRREIQAAIQSARDANADQLQQLQKQLQSITDNITYLTERFTVLENENSVLLPERDMIRKQHEEIIAQLNQQMAEKAAKQIQLNETRDQLRETNQIIVNIEEDIVQLKEDLIQDRADARTEKKRLKKEVSDTGDKIKKQKDMNTEKKKEVDKLNDEMLDSEDRLDALRKSIRKYDTSRARLQGRERALNAEIKKQIKVNQNLEQKGLNIANEDAKSDIQYQERRQALEEKLTDLNENIEREEGRVDDLLMRREKLQEEAREALKKKKVDAQKVDEMNQLLQAVKEELGRKAADFGRINQENIDTEEKIAALGESHKSIVSMLNKQLEDYRESLNKERKDRMELQARRDSVQKDLDDIRVETQRFMAEKNKAINEGKAKHQELAKEGSSLQQAIKENDNAIGRLKQELEKAEKNYSQMKSSMETRIATTEKEITSMDKERTEKQVLVDERTPDFEELEKEYEIRTKEYDQMKKDIVEMKNRKLGLEDSTKRTKTDIEKKVNPTAALRSDLKKKREESLVQMKQQTSEVRDVEEKIYAIGCKLKTVLDENQRFKEANLKLEQELLDLHQNMVDGEDLYNSLQDHIVHLKEILAQSWQKDNELEEEYAARDQLLVEDLTKLLTKTENREQYIGNITGQLDTELAMLATFLDNVSRRRPKESRESRRTGSRGASRDTNRSTPRRKRVDPVDKVAHANVQFS